MQGTPVRFLGREDPLEKGWPGESYGLYSPWGHKESDMTERLSLSPLYKESRRTSQGCFEQGVGKW